MNKNLAEQRNTCSTLTQDALALKQNTVCDTLFTYQYKDFIEHRNDIQIFREYTIPVHIYAHFKLYSRY